MTLIRFILADILDSGMIRTGIVPHKMLNDVNFYSKQGIPLIHTLDEIINHTESHGNRFALVDARFHNCDTLETFLESFSKSDVKLLCRFYYSFLKMHTI